MKKLLKKLGKKIKEINQELIKLGIDTIKFR